MSYSAAAGGQPHANGYYSRDRWVHRQSKGHKVRWGHICGRGKNTSTACSKCKREDGGRRNIGNDASSSSSSKQRRSSSSSNNSRERRAAVSKQQRPTAEAAAEETRTHMLFGGAHARLTWQTVVSYVQYAVVPAAAAGRGWPQ